MRAKSATKATIYRTFEIEPGKTYVANVKMRNAFTVQGRALLVAYECGALSLGDRTKVLSQGDNVCLLYPTTSTKGYLRITLENTNEALEIDEITITTRGKGSFMTSYREDDEFTPEFTGFMPLVNHVIDYEEGEEEQVVPIMVYGRKLKGKTYELKDHLSNLRAVVSDVKLWADATAQGGNGNGIPEGGEFRAEVLSYANYYAGGSLQAGRFYNTKGSTRGFGGQENDPEIYGEGNATTAEYWEYDSRLQRRWNVDPVVRSWESPYATFSNNPIYFNDPKGLFPDPDKDPGGENKGGNGGGTRSPEGDKDNDDEERYQRNPEGEKESEGSTPKTKKPSSGGGNDRIKTSGPDNSYSTKVMSDLITANNRTNNMVRQSDYPLTAQVGGVGFTRDLIDYSSSGDYFIEFDGKYYFEGVRVKPRWYMKKNTAMALPGGIYIDKGALFRSNGTPNIDLLRHEFGHILQYRLYGSAYFLVVAPTSAYSLSSNPTNHHNTWTEKEANTLSYLYFGRPTDWDDVDHPIDYNYLNAITGREAEILNIIKGN